MKTKINDIITDDLTITNFRENEYGSIEADWFGEQSNIDEVLEENGMSVEQTGAIRGVFSLSGTEAGDNTFEGTLNIA